MSLSKDVIMDDENEQIDYENLPSDEEISENPSDYIENINPAEEQNLDIENSGDYSGNDDIDQIHDDQSIQSADPEESPENPSSNPEPDANEENEGYTNANMVKDIEEKESELLNAKKQWQMTGEVQASSRPINSLVDENLDFQLATKLPIVHTVFL